MKTELPDTIHDSITCHCAAGDDLAHRRQFDAAIVEYEKAWALLPEPKQTGEAATWILAGIGDAHFLSARFVRAEEVFAQAILNAPGGLGNPFLHLRRGEALFETGDIRAAADDLMRAYMGAGVDIFRGEDPKYLKYLKTVAII